MHALIHVVNARDTAAELWSLQSTLHGEPALSGRVQLVAPTRVPGDLEPAADSLSVSLGDEAAPALAQVIGAWISGRSGEVRIRIVGSRGGVGLEPRDVVDLDATAAALLTLLRTTPDSGRPVSADLGHLISRIENAIFAKPSWGQRGYDEHEVDAFLDALIASIRAGKPMTAEDVHAATFSKPPIGKRGYAETDVDNLLDEVQRALS